MTGGVGKRPDRIARGAQGGWGQLDLHPNGWAAAGLLHEPQQQRRQRLLLQDRPYVEQTAVN